MPQLKIRSHTRSGNTVSELFSALSSGRYIVSAYAAPVYALIEQFTNKILAPKVLAAEKEFVCDSIKKYIDTRRTADSNGTYNFLVNRGFFKLKRNESCVQKKTEHADALIRKIMAW